MKMKSKLDYGDGNLGPNGEDRERERPKCFREVPIAAKDIKFGNNVGHLTIEIGAVRYLVPYASGVLELPERLERALVTVKRFVK